MAGDGELLVVDFLSDRQRKMMQLRVTTLLVRRYGIVDLRRHTMICEVLLQFVATLAEDGKDMPDGVARS